MIREVPLILLILLALGLAGCGDDAPSASLSGDLRYVDEPAEHGRIGLVERLAKTVEAHR